jgi:gentisate 1,2-dioxygenase
MVYRWADTTAELDRLAAASDEPLVSVWGPGDMFAVPSWSAAEHAVDEQAGEHADVFVLSDAPVLRALGLHREETLPAAQAVTSVFQPR